MILKGLKRNAIKKGVETHLKKRNSSSSGISNLKTLAILIDASRPVNKMAIKKLADELGVEAEKLRIIGYKEDNDIEDDRDVVYYNDKSFTVSGSLKSKILQDFITKDYDVLINFYEEEKLELDYLAAASAAKLKVGFSAVDHRINDLIIGTTTNDTNLFTKELKKYLKILQVI